MGYAPGYRPRGFGTDDIGALMNEQSKNSQAGYAPNAYPLSELTRTLPTLAGLQVFVAAACLGSFSKAAAHLCRTQGAVSRQVQQVEAHYGCALLIRHSAGLTLTREGERLLDVALRVLAELSDYARTRNEDLSIVTLRLPSTFAVRWLLPRMAQLERAMPRVELRIATSSDDHPDFAQRDIDAMIVRGTGEWGGVEAVELFPETLTPMCAPALAESIRSIGDLKSAVLLHAGPSRAEWRCWLDAVGGTGIDLTRGLVLDTLELALAAAADGHGVAIGDPRLARERLREGALVAPFGDIARNDASYFLVYPSRRCDEPKIQMLKAALIALARGEDE